jgi:hypothetical protein
MAFTVPPIGKVGFLGRPSSIGPTQIHYVLTANGDSGDYGATVGENGKHRLVPGPISRLTYYTW